MAYLSVKREMKIQLEIKMYNSQHYRHIYILHIVVVQENGIRQPSSFHLISMFSGNMWSSQKEEYIKSPRDFHNRLQIWVYYFCLGLWVHGRVRYTTEGTFRIIVFLFVQKRTEVMEGIWRLQSFFVKSLNNICSALKHGLMTHESWDGY